MMWQFASGLAIGATVMIGVYAVKTYLDGTARPLAERVVDHLYAVAMAAHSVAVGADKALVEFRKLRRQYEPHYKDSARA
jgi:hypothetical protein